MFRWKKGHTVAGCGVLTAALIAGAVWSSPAVTYAARDTFADVTTVLANDTDNVFTILEIVESESDAAIGYMVEGEEPTFWYTVDDAPVQLNIANPTKADIAVLAARGIIMPNAASEQSAYAMKYAEVKDDAGNVTGYKLTNNNLFANYVLGVNPGSVNIDVKTVLITEVTQADIDTADLVYLNLDGKVSVYLYTSEYTEDVSGGDVSDGDVSGADGVAAIAVNDFALETEDVSGNESETPGGTDEEETTEVIDETPDEDVSGSDETEQDPSDEGEDVSDGDEEETTPVIGIPTHEEVLVTHDAVLDIKTFESLADLPTGMGEAIYNRFSDTETRLPIIANDGIRNLVYSEGVGLRENLLGGVTATGNGNIVKDNLFVVKYNQNNFKSSLITDAIKVVDPVANIDFASVYTGDVTETSFSEVYTAVVQENYRRSQSGGNALTTTIDSARAISYIISYRFYSPIIYKESIRVLELEPTRSFVYYADEIDLSTEEGKQKETERKKTFVDLYVPQFVDNLDAVTIDGMTTSEFCGKVSDMYEQYDIIFIGADTTIMNLTPIGGGKGWQSKNYVYPGTLQLTNKDVNKGTALGGDNKTHISADEAYTYDGKGHWYYSYKIGEVDSYGEYVNVGMSGPHTAFYVEPSGNVVIGQPNSFAYGTYLWGRWSNQSWTRAYKNPTTEDYNMTAVSGSEVKINVEGIPGANWDSYSDYKWDGVNGCWWGRNSEKVPVWSDPVLLEDGFPYMWYVDSEQQFFYSNDYGSLTWRWNCETKCWEKYETSPVQQIVDYNDEDMVGMLYTHVGDIMNLGSGAYEEYWNDLAVYGSQDWVDSDIGNYNYNLRYSGNDILDSQVDVLLDYLRSGSPIIVDPRLFTTQGDETIPYDSAISTTEYRTHGRAVTIHGTLDNSSYLYTFLKTACDQEYLGKNLLIGAGETYSNASGTTVASALNVQKLELNLFDEPTPYAYTTKTIQVTDEWGGTGHPYVAIDQVTYLEKEADDKYYLNYEFSISNLSEVTPLSATYDVKLFIDGNNDAIFNTNTEELANIIVTNAQTGEVMSKVSSPMDPGGDNVSHYALKANTAYSVRRELPSGYVGSIYWKLQITQVGNSHIHDSETGLCAVEVEVGEMDDDPDHCGKKHIHVLQIYPGDTDEDNFINLEYVSETEHVGWNKQVYGYRFLIESIPDFKVEFDAISTTEFEQCFNVSDVNSGSYNKNSVYYDARNDKTSPQYSGTGGYLFSKSLYTTIRGAQAGDNPYVAQATKVVNGTTLRAYGAWSGEGDKSLYDYDMIIVGYASSFPNIASKGAVEALVNYADAGKSILYTNSTCQAEVDDSEYFDFKYYESSTAFSRAIRAQIGQDRYGVTTNWFKGELTGNGSLWANNNPVRQGVTQVASIIETYNYSNNRVNSDVAYAPNSNRTQMAPQTDGLTYQITGNNIGAKNRLAFLNIRTEYISKIGSKDLANTRDSYISPVNEGIVTMYPYKVGSSSGDIEVEAIHGGYSQDIHVTNTYAQEYQLDLDTDCDGDGLGDVTVWYVVSSFDNKDKSDAYDYTLNDVRNNYYIYNKGNITYSGVGNTFQGATENEMKLFVNTFVAAYNAGTHNPKVRIVDSASVNANDLSSVSVTYNHDVEDQTYPMYYQVRDNNNLTSGASLMEITYYVSGNRTALVGGTVTTIDYDGVTGIPVTKLDNERWTTYSWDTTNTVAYNAVRSGNTYRVPIPLKLLDETGEVDVYVKLTLRSDTSDYVVVTSTDKLSISELNLFDLD